MEKGTVVWVWQTSGEVTQGTFVGNDQSWLKVDIGSHIMFKPKEQVFQSEDEARAWQLVKRVKRLLKMGMSMEEVISFDEREDIQKAIELFPEELI